jgi:hypothetical protein
MKGKLTVQVASIQYHCFNKVYDVKSVSQLETMPLFANNY